ncbi:hypothetical protein NQZ79_g3740 [Umbelopsis isabellina]|nr:hypothetical protein NQZ79_g3740 [Umbelopsis isabellina]
MFNALLIHLCCLSIAPIVFASSIRRGLTTSQLDDFPLLSSEIQTESTGTVRKYYVAIEQLIWDYSPDHWDYYHNTSLNESPGKLWLASSTSTIGTKYVKSLYRAYNDSSFKHAVDVPQWQGMMGPIFRAEVGDTLEIQVRNLATKNYSMHPHGVKYSFEMEGAIYQDALSNSISPNQTYTYRWEVPPRSGPGPLDGTSLVWGYHSHVSETDVFDGLFGAIIIYTPGNLNADGQPKDIDHEIVSTIVVSDENGSTLLDQTLKNLSTTINMNKIETAEFIESNKKSSINGLLFSNPKDLRFQVGQNIHWHVLAWGTDFDTFNISWQEASCTRFGEPIDHINLLPASFASLKISPKRAGKFEFGCSERLSNGLVMQYEVDPKHQQN